MKRLLIKNGTIVTLEDPKPGAGQTRRFDRRRPHQGDPSPGIHAEREGSGDRCRRQGGNAGIHQLPHAFLLHVRARPDRGDTRRELSGETAQPLVAPGSPALPRSSAITARWQRDWKRFVTGPRRSSIIILPRAPSRDRWAGLPRPSGNWACARACAMKSPTGMAGHRPGGHSGKSALS